MSIPETNGGTPRKPLRLWPGVVAAVLLVLVRFALPLVFPDAAIFGVLGGVVAGLARGWGVGRRGVGRSRP